MGKRSRDVVQSGPTLLGQQQTNRGIITIAEVLPQEQGVQSSYQALQPGGPEWGRRGPRTLGFENQWVLHLGEPDGCREQRLHS